MTNQPERKEFPARVHIPVDVRRTTGTETVTPLSATSSTMSLNDICCTVNQYIPVSEKVQLTFTIADAGQQTSHLALQCKAAVSQVTPAKEEEGRSEYAIVFQFDTLSRTEQSILRIMIATARFANIDTFSVSVVVPVYNSQPTLNELTTRIQAVLNPLVECFEIILVNDCSRDGSWNQIIRLAEQNSNVRGINLMRNYGQHNALLVGTQQAQYEIIVNLDDDLQHPPEEIPKLLSKLSEGYDVVYGKPATRRHHSWRNLSSNLLKVIFRIILGSEMGEKSSAFRAFRAILRRGFQYFADAQLDIDVLLSWSAARVTYIWVDHQPRQHGKSGYTLRKLFSLAFSMLIGYSTLPLRIASGIGLTTSLFGLAMFFYVAIRRLLQTSYVPGFAFIASEVALFAGLQLFAIGVIGEYVARLHFRTMGKPPYAIREEVGQDVHGTAQPRAASQPEMGEQPNGLVHYAQ